jgi:hypothetical protein
MGEYMPRELDGVADSGWDSIGWGHPNGLGLKLAEEAAKEWEAVMGVDPHEAAQQFLDAAAAAFTPSLPEKINPQGGQQ